MADKGAGELARSGDAANLGGIFQVNCKIPSAKKATSRHFIWYHQVD
jgi:hypothetical protein